MQKDMPRGVVAPGSLRRFGSFFGGCGSAIFEAAFPSTAISFPGRIFNNAVAELALGPASAHRRNRSKR